MLEVILGVFALLLVGIVAIIGYTIWKDYLSAMRAERLEWAREKRAWRRLHKEAVEREDRYERLVELGYYSRPCEEWRGRMVFDGDSMTFYKDDEDEYCEKEDPLQERQSGIVGWRKFFQPQIASHNNNFYRAGIGLDGDCYGSKWAARAETGGCIG